MDQKIATQASASFRGQKLGGTFALRATPIAGKSPADLEPLLYAELARVAKDGVTAEELQRYKKATQVGLWSRLETNAGIRETLAQYLAVGTVADFQAAQERTQAVTREEVQRVARTCFPREGRNVLLTTRKQAKAPEGDPLKKAPERMKKLEGM